MDPVKVRCSSKFAWKCVHGASRRQFHGTSQSSFQEEAIGPTKENGEGLPGGVGIYLGICKITFLRKRVWG